MTVLYKYGFPLRGRAAGDGRSICRRRWRAALSQRPWLTMPQHFSCGVWGGFWRHTRFWEETPECHVSAAPVYNLQTPAQELERGLFPVSQAELLLMLDGNISPFMLLRSSLGSDSKTQMNTGEQESSVNWILWLSRIFLIQLVAKLFCHQRCTDFCPEQNFP